MEKEGKKRMEKGEWYLLNPPSVICGKIFKKVQCEYQVPNKPNEYSVCGIPEGGTKSGPFVLRFTENGRVVAMRTDPLRHLHIVK